MDEDDIEIDLGFDDEEAAAADAGQQLDGPEVKQEAVASVHEVEDRPTSTAVDEKPDTQAKPSTSGLNKKEGFGNVVHIVDMTWYTTDIEVEAACAPYGRVLNIKFFEDRSNGRSAGTCIVEFSSHDEARACIEGLNKTKVGDREVQVSWPGKHKTPIVRRPFEGPRGAGIGPMGGPMGPMGAGVGRGAGPMGMMGGPMGRGMGPMGMMGGPMRPGMMAGRGGMRPGMMAGGAAAQRPRFN